MSSLRAGLCALRSAFSGEARDWTQGPIAPALLLLSVPMVIEMSMESLFALVDIWWVAQIPRAPGSDADPVAVVGTTESLLSILYALAMGISMAAAATVARRIGEKDRDGAAVAAVQGVAMATAIAIVLGVAGWFFSDHLLALMGARPETIEQHGGYAAVMFGGNATVMLLFVLNSVFRSAGDAANAMRVLLLANGLNLVLDPCLIFGWGPFPEMGVTGAAVATNIGRGVGVVYQLWQIGRAGRQFQVAPRHWRIVREVVAPMVARAWTGAFQSLVMTTSWVGLVKVLSRYGESAVAGYTIGIRVVIFGLLPSWGIASAAAAMVGQSLGAKDPARAESAVWLAARWNLVVLSAVGAFFFFGAPWIVTFFTDPADAPAVAENAIACLRLIAVGFPFFAFGMCFSQAFNGAGDPWTPTWINLACFWLVEQPLARLLAGGVLLYPDALAVGAAASVPTVLGPSGVYWAISAAFALFAVVAGVLFRRGKWKTQVV